ncbi:hypothetical protein [Bradyrhizobium japonicum]|uniref:hypothetical protein n=1 Tax=Bradyrhizobium japonicum TaxID=375 RepID=UPI001BAC89FF|nr:hypothetical protein [Bradyrhizobium japonicum]MBR0962020.1 hypothetical protein [Bradyrhizobium japonicum]
MADTTKLSVEKALEKLRSSEHVKSKSHPRDDRTEELSQEIKRMRAQRRRLDQPPRKRS